MEGETLARLEKLLGRELKNAEKTRLQRIQDILKIGPNDALWSIIVHWNISALTMKNYRKKFVRFRWRPSRNLRRLRKNPPSNLEAHEKKKSRIW